MLQADGEGDADLWLAACAPVVFMPDGCKRCSAAVDGCGYWQRCGAVRLDVEPGDLMEGLEA